MNHNSLKVKHHLGKALFGALLLPSLVFAKCTIDEKIEMKQNGFLLSQISDICSEDVGGELDNISKKASGSYTMLRVGTILSDGTYQGWRTRESSYYDYNSDEVVTHYEQYEEKYKSLELENGFQVSFVNGSNSAKGFDLRSIMTMEFRNGIGRSATSTILLLGEFEFAHRFNQYFAPFVGFGGGIGNETFKETESSKVLSEDLVTAQLSLSAGITSDFDEHFGFYFKINKLFRNHTTKMKDGTSIEHYLTDAIVGLSYKY